MKQSTLLWTGRFAARLLFLLCLAQAGRAPAESEPPLIISQPVGVEVYAGSTVALRVTVKSSETHACEWRLNETNRVETAPAGTNSTLTLTLSNIQLAHAGAYSVVATNGSGSVTSLVAEVKVTALRRPAPPGGLRIR